MQKGPRSNIKDDDIRSNFYQQLRRLHDERNAPRSPNLGTGLTMLFSGTFEPKRLVNDDLASPFNVCRTVETEDLSKEAVVDLVERLGASQAASMVDRALDLVGGQPFLLQYLFYEAERGDDATSPEERFDQTEEKLLAGDSEHLTDLLSAIVNDQPVRAIAQKVEHGAVPFAATPEHRALVTLGFGRRDGSQLVARNRLYSEVASRHFLLAPAQATAVTGKVAPPGVGSLNFMADSDLRRDPKGVPVGYDLVGPRTGEERECALRLAAGQAGAVLFADGGFWGREYRASIESLGIELVTPDKHRLGERPPAEVAKARIRLVIESVFSTLRRQMRMETHLAKTPAGLVQPIAQRLLARSRRLREHSDRPSTAGTCRL